MDYLITLKEYLKLFWRLRKGTNISDVKFVRCYLELFLGGSSYKNSGENQVGVGFVSRIRLFHEIKLISTKNSLFFAMKKYPDKALNVLFYV
jgi:hypothetical protein